MNKSILIEEKKYSKQLKRSSFLVTITQEDRQLLCSNLEQAKEAAEEYALKHNVEIEVKLLKTAKVK